MPSGQPSNPTDQDYQFLQGLESGMNPMQAAKFAGAKKPHDYIANLPGKPYMVEEMNRIQMMHRQEMRMDRNRVQRIITDAIEFARLIGDPSTMIKGAAELNKMMGYYAPEKHIIELGANAQAMRDKLESLTDDELLSLADEDAIDVDFTALPFEDDTDDDEA